MGLGLRGCRWNHGLRGFASIALDRLATIQFHIYYIEGRPTPSRFG